MGALCGYLSKCQRDNSELFHKAIKLLVLIELACYIAHMITWTERKVAVSALVPYERNPRRISPASRARLKASIQEMGYHQRIVAQPDLRVIGGHQRIDVLKELGITEIIVLIPNRELSQKEFSRLLIQDNLPFGEFDFDVLTNDFKLDELKNWGMPDEWARKFKSSFDDEKAEEIPPLQQRNIISAPGNVWLLGEHRVMCGDSTHATDVAFLLGTSKPNLMVTDPPYGVEYDAEFRNGIKRADGSIVGARAIGKVENDDRHDWREAWALFPGNVAYVWHASYFTGMVQSSLEACDFETRASIIWAKQHMAIGRGHYHWQHEPCWYMVRKGSKGEWQGDRTQTTLWKIDKPHKSETGHSTQKPIECMRRPMLNNSAIGDAVYDPFLGSGTTIIAAEQSGRVCFGMEISPEYVDLICRRYTQFTNKPAFLEGGIRTFAEIEKSRS